MNSERTGGDARPLFFWREEGFEQEEEEGKGGDWDRDGLDKNEGGADGEPLFAPFW